MPSIRPDSSHQCDHAIGPELVGRDNEPGAAGMATIVPAAGYDVIAPALAVGPAPGTFADGRVIVSVHYRYRVVPDGSASVGP